MDKPPVFTQDWTTHHFSKWREVLGPFAGREKLRGLELGSFEGRSALFFLQEIATHPTARLICMDHWRDREIHGRFLHNILSAGVHDRCEVRKGDSHQMLRSIRQRFDFIYIDADHRAEAVLTDAVLAWPILLPGGVLIFDDYEWEKAGQKPPKLGIDAFLQVFAGQFEVLHIGWQVILKKV
ncbi:Methyltransferase domain-containing protein [Prosthecobacter debontii]|uniref:Methyltransferase domain-containing protein n=1 Tax=Prosthecobacter debontii TaxID=48467 RepID=A0A1T4X5P9_9BACT|nr:class I SAM-dependent methyltransferase [Prosthecobacter debontii]SKA84990.1 Methyltransferase domain-containing protein [Prosthecobacter debontii]